MALLATEKEEDGQGGCHWWLLVGIGAAGGQAVETRWSDWWRWQGARLVTYYIATSPTSLFRLRVGNRYDFPFQYNLSVKRRLVKRSRRKGR